MSRLLYVLVAE